MLPFTIDPEKDTICGVLRRWADIQPDAPVFLELGKTPLTYAGLVGVMDHVRDRLRGCGLGPNDRVALVLASGPDLAALLFGTMGVAVPFPLKPKQTEIEFAAFFRDHDVKALIVKDGSISPAVKAATVLGIPIFRAQPAGRKAAGEVAIAGTDHPEIAPAISALEFPGPKDFCVMVTTSGTSGASRVVPSSHSRRLRAMGLTVTAFQLSQKDRYLLARPLYYSGGVGLVLNSALSGGSVAFLKEFTPEAFFRIMRELGPTWYGAGPTVQRALHAYLAAHPDAAESIRLRFILASSGALEPGVVEDLECFLSAPIIQDYSTTEIGRITSNPLPPRMRKHGTVGLPIDCEVAIKSVEGDLLGAGQQGEVAVRGERVAANYENGPEGDDNVTQAFKDG